MIPLHLIPRDHFIARVPQERPKDEKQRKRVRRKMGRASARRNRKG